MDPKDSEEFCNTGPDEETMARDKKRSRRVSFAEITSVHVFDRDDDYETPPDSKPSSENPESGQSNELLGFHRDSGDSDDSKDLSQNEDDDEGEDEDERELFVRDMNSYSPGSAIGSATSNDEDNFFGPVSASFIRSGQLSDSAVSDDNHDITLDSTAFSMHFRSLMHSDSEGNFKTQTGVHLTYEEKTPTENSTPTNPGSFMVLTGVRKPIPRCSVSGGKSSGCSDSNNMTLIEVNPHRYDYGRLSPSLDALLAEGSKGVHDISVSDQINISKSSIYLNQDVDERKSDLIELKDSGDNELGNIDKIKLFESNGGSATSHLDQISYACSSSTKDTLPADASSIGHQSRTLHESTQGVPFGMDKESGNDALEASGSKVELGGGNIDTLTVPNNSLQMDLMTQQDCGYLGHDEDPMSEKYLKGGRYTPDIGHKTNQQYGSPLERSVSSLGTKRRQIFLDTAVPSSSGWEATPFARKQPFSSLNKENIRYNESTSSIKNSISRFKVVETSPFGSMLEVGNKNSKPALVDYICKLPSIATLLDENSKDPELKQLDNNEDPELKELDISVIGLEEHLLSAAQKNREKISTIEIDSSGLETAKSIRILRQTEDDVATVHDKEFRDCISSGSLCNDQCSKLSAALARPIQFSGSGKNMQLYPSNSHNPIEGGLVTPKPDSSLIEVAFEFNENKQITGSPDKLIHSPSKGLEQKLCASLKYKGILPGVSKQQDQCNKLVISDLRQDSADARENSSNASHLTPIAEGPTNLGSSLKENIVHAFSLNENRVHATPLFININADESRYFDKSKWVGNKDFLCYKESENIGGYQTPLTYRTTLNSQFGSRDLNFRTRTDPTRFKGKLPEKASSYESASPYARKRTATATQLEKRYLQDVENSGRKRRIEEIIHMDKDNIDDIGRDLKSPKVTLEVEGSVSEFPSEHYLVRNSEAENIRGYASPRHWADVFSRFYGATKQLLLPLADKLNSRELDILEDMLGRLQKAKKYEKLCTELHSQRIHNHLGDHQQKRVSEARWLQQMLVYEHAKLQLLRLKQERLLKKVQLLHSGIQESHIYKFNSLQHLCIPGARDAQNKETHLPSLSVDLNSKNGDAYNKVTAMRQEHGSLDQKVKNLITSLHASCKIKGEPSPAETIVLVNDHLKKRASCRFIRQDLQLWEVDDLESKSGHHIVVLDYCQFLSQRMTVNAGPVSSIVTINKLTDVNILKNFPNINACTAFAFVCHAEAVRKLGSPKSLALETQITSFLLGNLLDVVEEVQIARIELPNLIKTSFHSPCVEQLNLQLYFIDFKTGCKVILIFDMTYMNRGIYPSENLLSHIQIQTSGTQTLLPQLLSAEIKAAVGALKAGHSRILRLCRCVSQVIQASSR